MVQKGRQERVSLGLNWTLCYSLWKTKGAFPTHLDLSVPAWMLSVSCPQKCQAYRVSFLQGLLRAFQGQSFQTSSHSWRPQHASLTSRVNILDQPFTWTSIQLSRASWGPSEDNPFKLLPILGDHSMLPWLLESTFLTNLSREHQFNIPPSSVTTAFWAPARFSLLK